MTTTMMVMKTAVEPEAALGARRFCFWALHVGTATVILRSLPALAALQKTMGSSDVLRLNANPLVF